MSFAFLKQSFFFFFQKPHGNDDLNTSMTSHHFEEESVSDVQYS